MQKVSQNSFNYCDSITESTYEIRHPKSNKSKLIKDLNYKAFKTFKSETNSKFLSNSKEKDHLINKQRTRNKSLNEMESLLQMIIPGAKIIKCDWMNNKLNGDVIIEYQNGNSFYGKYHNGLRVQGRLVYKNANCEYEGSFFAQKFSGFGRLTYYEGRTIEGEWQNRGIVGNATITYPNKDVYYGPVDQKLYKHGEGYLFLNNGHKYVGTFKRGSISGVGSYFKGEKLIVKGVWHKGKLTKQINCNSQQTDTEADLQLTRQSKALSNFKYKIEQSTAIKTSNLNHRNFEQNDEILESSGSILSLNTNQKYALFEN